MNEITAKVKLGCLLSAGTRENYNTMTIGWGTIGSLWGGEVFICFVRPSRYTYDFMEKNKLFTISFYDRFYKEELSYLGTHSGANIDKVKDVGFNVIALDGSITFREAYETYVCEKVYYQDMDYSLFPEDVKKTYYACKDVHRLYIGKIIKKYNEVE